jgi:hypothetical protein
MPVLVRNTQAGPAVFSDPVENVALEWQASGDPSGEDVQQVPDKVVTDNVNFLKCIQKGIFEVVEATEEVKASLAKQVETYKNKQDASAQAAAGSIDRQQQNDIVTVPCVGHSNRGTGQCGELVPVKEKTKSDRPPLCPKHEGLANQYVVTETEDFDENGKAIKAWSRTAVDARS